MRKGISAAILLLAVLCLVSSKAMAAEAQAATAGEWSFSVSPYVWFASLEGEVATIRGIPPADVDASFSDILENLDFAFMGYLEARRDRWGFGADFVYLDITADGNGPTPAFSKAELDLKAFIGTFTPFYRALDEETFTLDVLAGARLWSTDTDLTLKSGAAPGRSEDETETWADPIVGARSTFAATENVSVRADFDIGGFGAASDITYQLLTLVSYAFTDSISAGIGYRYLKVDYDDDGFLLNTEIHGPILGARIRF